MAATMKRDSLEERIRAAHWTPDARFQEVVRKTVENLPPANTQKKKREPRSRMFWKRRT